MCVCVNAHVCEHVCAHVVKAGSGLRYCPQSLSTSVLRQGLALNMELDWMASKPQAPSCLLQDYKLKTQHSGFLHGF